LSDSGAVKLKVVNEGFTIWSR